MKIDSKQALELLDKSKGLAQDDYWISHSICVGDTAGVIAKALNLDEDYTKTLGYVHDIGKRFGWSNGDSVLVHATKGYYYLKELNINEDICGICLKHSFLNNDINCLANGRDYTDNTNEYYEFVKNYIKDEYNIYEKIINLCDLMCTSKVNTVDDRINEIISRKGTHLNTEYHINEAHKLKSFFDEKLGYNLYNLFNFK